MKRFRYLKLLRIETAGRSRKTAEKTRLGNPTNDDLRGGHTYRYPGKLMAEIYGGLNQFQLKFALTQITYGCYARLNQIFIDTEIKTKATNIIDVGKTFNEYVKNLAIKEGKANKELLETVN